MEGIDPHRTRTRLELRFFGYMGIFSASGCNYILYGSFLCDRFLFGFKLFVIGFSID